MLESTDKSIQHLLTAATEQLSETSESPLLDAEVLLCHCLNKTRSFLRAWPEHQPSSEHIARYQALLGQRQQGTPIAYLTGEREFWSRPFKVDEKVLIPRPDTELLIELALAILAGNRPSKVIDLGTGSGIIAITLSAEQPLTTVFATDLSEAALEIAEHNAKQLNTGTINFLQSHWFDNINETDFDLVLSNPPYIAEDDPHLQQGDVRFEPISALVSAENGLQDISLLAEQARRHLKSGGQLLVEHGYNQGSAVRTIFSQLGYRQINTHNDLSGNPRVTSGLWKPL